MTILSCLFPCFCAKCTFSSSFIVVIIIIIICVYDSFIPYYDSFHEFLGHFSSSSFTSTTEKRWNKINDKHVETSPYTFIIVFTLQKCRDQNERFNSILSFWVRKSRTLYNIVDFILEGICIRLKLKNEVKKNKKKKKTCLRW